MDIYEYCFECFMYILLPMAWFWIGYSSGKAKVEKIVIKEK